MRTSQRAIDFYTKAFGWRFDKWPGPQDYWLITTGPGDRRGIDGGLIQRRGTIDGTGVIGCVCTVEADSVDASVEKVVAHGGNEVVQKMAIPGVGWLAYCKDTEGNIFGIMQNDPSAR